jgi:hypothetical protein
LHFVISEQFSSAIDLNQLLMVEIAIIIVKLKEETNSKMGFSIKDSCFIRNLLVKPVLIIIEDNLSYC